MAKKKSNSPNSPNIKKRRTRKGVPLKRYNAILSTVVKDYKKKGVEYDLKEVRKGVSEVYQKFKNVPPSRIPKKEILKAFSQAGIPAEQKKEKDTYTIKSTEVPKEYFDVEKEWFELGEGFEGKDIAPNGILDFNNAFPEIPIVIKTPNNMYSSVGSIGNYQGSELQKFINEDLREEFNNKSGFPFFGTPAWEDIENKPYAFWGIEDSELPKNIPDYTEVSPKKQVIIEERQKKAKEEKAKRKQQPKKLEKSKDKKPVPKPKEVPTTRGENVAKISADFREREKELREDYKDGIYTKEEFKAERKILQDQLNKALDKFNKGGKI